MRRVLQHAAANAAKQAQYYYLYKFAHTTPLRSWLRRSCRAATARERYFGRYAGFRNLVLAIRN